MKKPWGYWCKPFADIKQRHKWRIALSSDKKKYVCPNCGRQSNKKL